MIALLLAAQIVGWSAEPDCCPLPHQCGFEPAVIGHRRPCVDPCEGVERDPLKFWETWTPDITRFPSVLSLTTEEWRAGKEPVQGPPAPADPYAARIAQLEQSVARSRRMLWYVALDLTCAGADLWSTSDRLERGGVELNPLGQTTEKRVGLKLTQAAVSAVANWLIDRKWGAKAGWISAGTTAGIQCAAAVHNLSQ